MNCELSTSLLESAIRRRHAVRTFSAQPLDDRARADIADVLAQAAPSEGRIIHLRNPTGGRSARLGTYGVISGAPDYLVLMADGQQQVTEAARAAETAVLHLTARGYATCWMAGTYRAGDFGAATGIDDYRSIPAVIAIGRQADKRRRLDRLMAWGASSRSRKSPQKLFFVGDTDCPLLDQDLLERLEYLRLAPSGTNRQPWRVIFPTQAPQYWDGTGHDTTFRLLIQRTSTYWLDAGIALAHLAVAFSHFTYEPWDEYGWQGLAYRCQYRPRP